MIRALLCWIGFHRKAIIGVCSDGSIGFRCEHCGKVNWI